MASEIINLPTTPRDLLIFAYLRILTGSSLLLKNDLVMLKESDITEIEFLEYMNQMLKF